MPFLCMGEENGLRKAGCIVTLFGLPVLVLVGLTLNIVSLFLFTTRAAFTVPRIHSRPRILPFLVALCIFDSAKLILSVLIIVIGSRLPQIKHSDSQLAEAFRPVAIYSLRYLYPLLMATNYASIWTITAICIQRFFAICHPLSTKYYQALGHHRPIILTISAVTFAINIPRYWELSVMHTIVENKSTIDLAPGPLHRSRNTSYLILMDGIVHTLFLYALPLLILCVLNVQIIVAIVKARSDGSCNRPKLSSKQKREHRRAYMVLAIILLFFLCYTLPVVARCRDIYQKLNSNGEQEDETAHFMYDLGNFLVNVNSTLNPLIYFLFTRRFNDILQELTRKSRNSDCPGLDISMNNSAVTPNHELIRARIGSRGKTSTDPEFSPFLEPRRTVSYTSPSKARSIEVSNYRGADIRYPPYI